MISVPLAYSYARRHGIPLRLREAFALYFQGVSPFQAVYQRHRADRLGLALSRQDCELHLLARGNLPRVIDALHLAQQNDLPVPFGIAAAEDLAGSDMVQIVREALEARKRGDEEHHLLLAIKHEVGASDT